MQCTCTGPDVRTTPRCSLVAKHDEGEVIGVGDHPTRKIAEHLAALSALYQLDAIGAVRFLFVRLTSANKQYA